MKEYEFNYLNNFIAGWYIDPSVCDSIVEKGEANLNAFSSGIKSYKDADLQEFDSNLFEQYFNNFWPVIENYKTLYPYCFQELCQWAVTRPRIQRYDAGAFYSEAHCENNGYTMLRDRHLAYMTYLNDIDEGGGTEFLHQKLVSPAKKGLTLIWPAEWTHYHRGVVANNNTKYIITGWCVFHN